MSDSKPRPRTALPPLFRAVLRPFLTFFHMEASGGLLLLGSAVIGLVWANTAFESSYRSMLSLPLELGFGSARAHFTVQELINDGLMSLFFFVVGMEIKRELAVGELSSIQRAILPAIAAAGGMIVPAVVYLLFNREAPASNGWAIPMATDIAFATGCLSLLRSRVPNALIVFLVALAIFDDLGGILVIALFYGQGLSPSWLGIALGLTLLLVGANRLYVRSGLVYALGGIGLWYALHHGGVHATIAGVITGMCIPARPRRPGTEVLAELHAHTGELIRSSAGEDLRATQLVEIEEKLEDIEPPLNRFVHLWHPYVAFVIVPLFGLANAGVSLAGVTARDLVGPVPLGIALGLVFGKSLGITCATVLAVKTGLSPMPSNARMSQLVGVATVGGIGFTVALFIAQLAFLEAPAVLDQAKLGILVGSAVSAIAGYLILRVGKPARAAS